MSSDYDIQYGYYNFIMFIGHFLYTQLIQTEMTFWYICHEIKKKADSKFWGAAFPYSIDLVSNP